MDFTKKNDFIVKHKKEMHFEKDFEFFNQKCPNSKLQPELKRLNSFNRTKIHGMILNELLDKVSPEEILNYRVEKPTEAVIETVEQAIAIIYEIDPEFIPKDIDKDDLAALSKEAIGKTVEAFRTMAQFLIEKDRTTVTIGSVDGVKKILFEIGIDAENTAEEFLLFLVDKTEDEIKKIVEAGKAFQTKQDDGSGNKEGAEIDIEKKEEELNDKETELDEKRSELDDKESELDEKEDELNDKEQELEEKEIILEEKTAELEKAAAELKNKAATKTTTKKKEAKAKSSRK